MKNLYIMLVDKTLSGNHPYQCQFFKSNHSRNHTPLILEFAELHNISPQDVIFHIFPTKRDWEQTSTLVKSQWDWNLVDQPNF